ncbi:MAG TPA: PEP-CTERM sorting domain-containing protein [Armatimonadota bacterium]|jgi:hypothetical protein
MSITRIAVLAFLLAAIGSSVSADLACVELGYIGSLSTTGGGLSYLAGNHGASWTPVTINWNVNRNANGSWHYTYDLSAGRDFSHFILETSNAFTCRDIFNACGPYGSLGVGTWNPGPSNEHMPRSLYGIKFDSTSGTKLHIVFDSTKAPVWGDFYVRDGKGYEAWNKGFDGVDPTVGPSNGSVGYHILRPDSDSCPKPVPEPGTMALMALGLTGLGWVRRRRGAKA